ncbi:ketoacyl-synthetase C-terminal extension domain-containing protein [Paenibacillus amylolyticus]|nr:ketoacyl-synthetase C-terminal extension domain-containing protein [Paenibacillus amylolyticus]WFR65510.1 ketoacyl-synthetase C-terminal extension domain-containing protein [Paenibacillus amylolyticus]
MQHFDRPNRNIDFSGTPVYVNTRNRIWPAEGEPVRMGVSAFGFSGTNCHLILEQAGGVETNRETETREYLFPLSAKTLHALQQYISKYTKYLKTTDHTLADICYTAGTSRTHYEHRLVRIASSKEELLAQLAELEEGGLESIREQSVPESNQLHLTAHCETYLGGGEVSWPSLYSGRMFAESASRRIHLKLIVAGLSSLLLRPKPRRMPPLWRTFIIMSWVGCLNRNVIPIGSYRKVISLFLWTKREGKEKIVLYGRHYSSRVVRLLKCLLDLRSFKYLPRSMSFQTIVRAWNNCGLIWKN